MPSSANTSFPHIGAKIFVCYRRVDLPKVNEIMDFLVSRGVNSENVFFDVHDFFDLAYWKSDINKSISNAEIFIVLYSPRMLLSYQCLREIYFAIRMNLRDRSRGPRLIIPIVINKRLITATPISSFDYLPFNDEGFRKLHRRILRSDEIRMEDNYVNAFRGIGAFIKYILAYPALSFIILMANFTVKLSASSATLLSALLICWYIVIFFQGRHAGESYFEYNKAIAQPLSTSAIELSHASGEQNQRSCNEALPIFWKEGYCVEVFSITKDTKLKKINLHARINNPIMLSSTYPLCTFPNTTFAPWLRVTFTAKNGGVISNRWEYRIFEGFIGTNYNGIRNIDVDLKDVMRHFSSYKSTGREARQTPAEHEEFERDFENILKYADSASISVSRSWCMPAGYRVFYDFAKMFFSPKFPPPPEGY
ncbi:toll/interleukin-1 receptor domain-containing protein [Azospirillum argentinense]